MKAAKHDGMVFVYGDKTLVGKGDIVTLPEFAGSSFKLNNAHYITLVKIKSFLNKIKGNSFLEVAEELVFIPVSYNSNILEGLERKGTTDENLEYSDFLDSYTNEPPKKTHKLEKMLNSVYLIDKQERRRNKRHTD